MFLMFGVIFEVLATMVGTAGKQMVSYSGRAEKKAKARSFKVAGLLLTTLLGPLLDMAAYGFAPQAIIAPLNGLDIVWNTCSAPYTLGERLTRKHILGSALVFFGAVSTALLGPHHSAEETLEWMQDTFLRFRFVAYLAFFGGCLMISFVTLSIRPKGVGDKATLQLRQHTRIKLLLWPSEASGSPDTEGAKARGIALASTAGAIAGNMYFISAGLGLLRSSAASGDWSAWSNWLPYPVLLGGILVALANIPLITKALEEYEAIFVVTLFEGSHIVTACLSGAWVLKELEGGEVVMQFLYWCCICVIVMGLLVIQSTAAGAGVLTRQDVHPLAESSPHMSDISTAASNVAMTDAARGAIMAAEEAGEEEKGNGGSIRQVQVQPELTRTESGSVCVWAGSLSGIASAKLAAPEDEEGDSETEDDTTSDGDEETGSVREQAPGRSS